MAPKKQWVEKAEEKADKEEKKGRTAATKRVLTKEQALKQITSLNDDDDARETMSKKISWVLRKGASSIGLDRDKEGWVNFKDLCNCVLFEDDDRDEQKIMKVVEESNVQKSRYDLKDGGKKIKAVERKDRKQVEDSPGKQRTSLASAIQAGKTELRADAVQFTPGQSFHQGPAAAANPYAGYGMNPYVAAVYASMQAQAASASMMGAGGAGAHGAPKRFTGYIKSFNTEKGYGFIESHEAYQSYGRDVFLHKAHLGSHAVGAAVTFDVEMNKQGMPQARDLKGKEGGKGKGKGKEKGKKDGDAQPKAKAKDKAKKEGKKKEEKAAEGDADDYPEIKYGAETPARLKEDKMEKKMKKIIKEGGKRGVEIEGAADMGGLQFFCTSMDEPGGDEDLLYESMRAMNAKSDPSEEERKGGSGRIGKMLISKNQDDTKLAIVTYCPPSKHKELKADQWIQDVLKALGGGKMSFGDAYTAKAVIDNDADKGLFVLKLKDSAITESINYLKGKGLFPDKPDDSDDDPVFGDDDFPS